jgi:uncharacterized protein YkwD
MFRNRTWRALLLAVLLCLAAWPVYGDGPVLGPAPRLPANPPAQPAATTTPRGAVVAHAVACVQPVCIYLPFILRPASPLWANTQDRDAVRRLYTVQYLGSEGVPTGWNGNQTSCTPGSTAPAFQNAVLQRINYFRAMAGVAATISLSGTYNSKAQASALMMSANQALNHTPPSTWQCYTADGAQAAGRSNLALGVNGPDAIALYMQDPGSGNGFAGHRRWILYPQTREMGTGDVDGNQGSWPANDLWVMDSHIWDTRPATREAYVAWPPPGYVPYQVVFARWSFAYAGADFSSATVTMSTGGQSVAVTKEALANGYGENTLVWRPSSMQSGDTWPRPAADTLYTVTVQGAIIAGQNRDFTYQVTVFDPG